MMPEDASHVYKRGAITDSRGAARAPSARYQSEVPSNDDHGEESLG